MTKLRLATGGSRRTVVLGMFMLSTHTVARSASPFQIKGVAYRGLVVSLQERIEGTTERFFEQLRDDSLRNFFEQSFLASQWYDIYPLYRATGAAARALGLTETEGLRQLTRANAERDVAGVYRTLLHVASPEQISARVQRLHSTLFDFGAIALQRETARSIGCIASAIPIVICEWYANIVSEYVKQALRLANVLNASCRIGISPPTGEEHGAPVTRIQLEWTW